MDYKFNLFFVVVYCNSPSFPEPVVQDGGPFDHTVKIIVNTRV